MQIDLTDEQLAVLNDLVQERIRTIHSEIRRSRLQTVHDELQHDKEMLQQLHEQLRNVHYGQQAIQAWEGYIETRQTPSNPPPGS